MTEIATPGAPAAACSLTEPTDPFAPRHLGPTTPERAAMLATLGLSSLDELTDKALPQTIRVEHPLAIGAPAGESDALAELKAIAAQNKPVRSMIGMGYHGTLTPPVILRSLFENPLWYTPYTPYQAEIAQGRLEALLNFQTMVSELTGLPLANASMLDEATAAAEAMAMCYGIARQKKSVFLVADHCHPQTIAVVRSRASSMGIDVQLFSAEADPASLDLADACGVLVQYPATCGEVLDFGPLCEVVHEAKALVVAACDILSLALLSPPGEWAGGGADIAVGSTQRFGVPMGYGGPHAGFMATHDKHARKMPGRIVGVSVDSDGKPAYRLAIQTREQHIKRDRATSNICTAQVLLAIAASMYAVYHGPEGIKRIARKVHGMARTLAAGLREAGAEVITSRLFDTVTVRVDDADGAVAKALEAGINLRKLSDDLVTIACDETTTLDDVANVIAAFGGPAPDASALLEAQPSCENRTSPILTHPVFSKYHVEHELLRYLTRLQSKDISLANSMIPLGSCTMKLNASAQMIPITWPEFANVHPYAPAEQVQGYTKLMDDLGGWLSDITGFAAISFQPNAGSQGEYAGLMAIRSYHRARGEAQRNVCLIPTSAHGTNPASAVIAGMKVVAVGCDEKGNIDVADLRAKAEQHASQLAALMITYPSTHGVFEQAVKDICAIVHEHGGQVYMDGANMNAQVGLCKPGELGADVCHLNLHKTFAIPHGGGGPGMGPIGVAQHLVPHLPASPMDVTSEGEQYAVSAARHGSPMILPISWMYVRMLGSAGLKQATQVAILSANYMAGRLKGHYPIVYTGEGGYVAHEFIIDCRAFEKRAGIRVEDIAKRLMDFGFHCATMSWPVAGTLMIEPTESESQAELDRFCDALIAIREEIEAVATGGLDLKDNPLKHAPHTAAAVTSDDWQHGYSREQAAYPAPWLRDHKYWPPVGRIDNAYGDRNLICTCPGVEDVCETEA